jgi:hypothetical protein
MIETNQPIFSSDGRDIKERAELLTLQIERASDEYGQPFYRGKGGRRWFRYQQNDKASECRALYAAVWDALPFSFKRGNTDE